MKRKPHYRLKTVGGCHWWVVGYNIRNFQQLIGPICESSAEAIRRAPR